MRCNGMILLLFLSMSLCSGQSYRSLVNNGNEKYEEQNFREAEQLYRGAATRNKDAVEGHFNLGGALYKQDKLDESLKGYEEALSKEQSKETRAHAYYNMGNSFLRKQDLTQAINAYRESLKLNPADEDAKHNLSYALRRQQQKQQQQQNQDKDKKDDQKNEDQKKQDQDDQQQNQQDQQKDKQDQQQDQQTPQNQQGDSERQKKPSRETSMARSDAERILEALKNSEKDIQKKLRAKKAVRSRTEKDW